MKIPLIRRVFFTSKNFMFCNYLSRRKINLGFGGRCVQSLLSFVPSLVIWRISGMIIPGRDRTILLSFVVAEGSPLATQIIPDVWSSYIIKIIVYFQFQLKKKSHSILSWDIAFNHSMFLKIIHHIYCIASLQKLIEKILFNLKCVGT